MRLAEGRDADVSAHVMGGVVQCSMLRAMNPFTLQVSLRGGSISSVLLRL